MAACTCADPALVADAIKEQTTSVTEQMEKDSQKIDETLFGQTMSGSHGAPAPARGGL